MIPITAMSNLGYTAEINEENTNICTESWTRMMLPRMMQFGVI